MKLLKLCVNNTELFLFIKLYQNIIQKCIYNMNDYGIIQKNYCVKWCEIMSYRILAIGNSYSNNAIYYISRIAESMGQKISATSLYQAGCPLERHVQFYNNDTKAYKFYVDDVNISGADLNTMKEVFKLNTYDYVTIQQAPARATLFSTYWTKQKPWLTDLYAIIKKHQPGAKVLIHQTWSFSNKSATEGTEWWTTTYKNSREMFLLIKDAYEKAADKLGIDKEKGIIPVGRAIQLAKDEYGYWDAYNPGYAEKYLPDGSDANAAKHCENRALYTDDIDHLNHRGRYLASCVWLEKIFGYDCRTATYYPEGVLTEEDCIILRAIAHEAVTGEKSFVEGDWRIIPEGDEVEIVHYMGTVPKNGVVKIPAEICGKAVKRVNVTTFKYIKGINKVILPKANIVYDKGAFYKLKTVKENSI